MTMKPIDGAPPPIADQDFAEAHRALVGDHSIQFDLPQAAPLPPPPPPSMDAPSPDWVSPLLTGFFYVGAALLVLLLVILIWRRMSDGEWAWPWRRRAAEETDEAVDWRPAEAPARQLLGEADVLAAQGRFAEAARLLLFRSIDDIDSRRPALVRPALTSRDIAALPAIPDRPRTAFARIAMLVERSLFAGRPLVEGDWRDCRSAYEDFAFAEGWRG
jgi:hypothetical protein